ncbi:MAG: hypothetical protein ACLTDM_15200 [Clostridium butyricum]
MSYKKYLNKDYLEGRKSIEEEVVINSKSDVIEVIMDMLALYEYGVLAIEDDKFIVEDLQQEDTWEEEQNQSIVEWAESFKEDIENKVSQYGEEETYKINMKNIQSVIDYMKNCI